MYTMDSGLSS